MRIALDARLFGASKHRGLGRYISSLVYHLAALDKTNQYFLLVDPSNPEQPESLPDNFKLVAAPFRVYSLAEQIKLPGLIKKLKVDFTHYPHFNVPLLAPQPYLVTVHDLIVNRFPNRKTSTLPWFLYAIKLAAYHIVLRQTIKRADKIIAVSQATANDITTYYPAAKPKIKIIYLAPHYQSPNDLALDYDYIMVVGSAYPHKNLERFIKAYQISGLADRNIKLLLVGRIDWFMERLKKYALDNNLIKGLVFWGQAKETDLAALYSRTLAYIMPSLWEGFGLGPLEALGHKKPVLVSDLPIFREILGQAAWYFDHKSEIDMADKLIRVVDLNKTDNFSLAKLPRVYSWNKTAKETLEVYQEVKF
ncbi:MAG: glycosyltransferase family 4 protein [Patescibacteria group bacterium]